MNRKKIKNIIFDLGGVIINLDPARSYNAFASLGGVKIQHVMDLIDSTSLFDDYEKGLITSPDFRIGICQLLNKDIPDHEIDLAWNKMLLGIPKERLETIGELKNNYKLFVLSNTNQIHITAFEEIMEESFGLKNYQQLFDKIYYSNHINKRKPDADIYQYVLEDKALKPEETLFFEDNKQNIEAAAKLNIQTHWVSSNQLNLGYIRDEFF